MMLFIYVAGPLMTGGQPIVAIENALKYAEILRIHDFIPYVPHLCWFWKLRYPNPETKWLELDFNWIARCDSLLRIPGASYGADKEVLHAKNLGKPVYTSLHELFTTHGINIDIEAIRKKFNLIIGPLEVRL